MWTKTVLMFLAIAALTTVNVYAQPKNLRVGKIIPQIALKDTAGSIRKLSDLAGKVVLIDFWASWCGPCRKSNPALVKIYDEYRDKDFEIYGVSVDKSATAWKLAINTDNLTWVHVNDNSNNEHGEIGTSDWQINYIPTSFLLDKKGKIIAINPSVKQLRSHLKKHLK